MEKRIFEDPYSDFFFPDNVLNYLFSEWKKIWCLLYYWYLFIHSLFTRRYSMLVNLNQQHRRLRKVEIQNNIVRIFLALKLA